MKKNSNKWTPPALPGVTDKAWTPLPPSTDERPQYCDERSPEEKAASATFLHKLDLSRKKWKGLK